MNRLFSVKRLLVPSLAKQARGLGRVSTSLRLRDISLTRRTSLATTRTSSRTSVSLVSFFVLAFEFDFFFSNLCTISVNRITDTLR